MSLKYGTRSNRHSVSELTTHIVWLTKYRDPVLRGYIKVRCKTLYLQICEEEDVLVLKGVVSSDHIHINYRPSQTISDLQRLLG